ncbi:P-loop ATPase, Sll1717 family [Sphingomonas sp. ac-8]|uniref:P-loop ATPase, Sll1717 family n=1 Tax=Sphingomonas sp. ac-8 TaxID=3242977 RepID=UPI003A7F6C27
MAIGDGSVARQLRNIHLGMVDGKFEYVTPQDDRDNSFYDAFLIPENVDISSLNNRRQYFVEGFRGTGKTSLLRWLAEMKRRDGALTEFVLFKSDLPEEKREGLSSQVGITWLETDRNKMEFSQDFKTSWTWFILHKIGEIVQRHPTASTTACCSDFMRLLGLRNNAFKKVMGFLPKLEKLSVEISSDFDFFSAKLGAEFTGNPKEKRFTTLSALNAALIAELKQFPRDFYAYLFFDELEVFYDEKSKYDRDQRMVRDLLFSVSKINEVVSSEGIPIHILAAVRSEVLDGFGALGQEVDRVVHDRGLKLAWHFGNRNLDHPLFKIVARKIKQSDEEMRQVQDAEIIREYFPAETRGHSIEKYLLDRSFYKPRDLIWRLTIVQKQFPNEVGFTERALLDTEGDFSAVMWDEIKYELTANYSPQEIDVIETAFSGFRTEFFFDEFESRMAALGRASAHARSFMQKHGLYDVLSDLYRLGAIGNFFREGPKSSQIRNRWAFRGDPTLLFDKKLTINPSLTKRLSLVAPHQRSAQRRQRRAVQSDAPRDEVR